METPRGSGKVRWLGLSSLSQRPLAEAVAELKCGTQKGDPSPFLGPASLIVPTSTATWQSFPGQQFPTVGCRLQIPGSLYKGLHPTPSWIKPAAPLIPSPYHQPCPPGDQGVPEGSRGAKEDLLE